MYFIPERVLSGTTFVFTKCDQCSNIFSRKENINKHVKAVHPKSETLVPKCLECDEEFSSTSNLN